MATVTSILHVLYQNTVQDVTVLDVPTSLADAQGFCDRCRLTLISSEALERPWRSNEPRSSKAQDRPEIQVVGERGREEAILYARETVRRDYVGSFRLPRCCVPSKSSHKRTRSISDTTEDHNKSNDAPLAHWSEIKSGLTSTMLDLTTKAQPSERSTGARCAGIDAREVGRRLVKNASDKAVELEVHEKDKSWTFYIPARSSFFLSDCAVSFPFYRALISDTPERSDFDVVVLDPPWPNRSVQRGKQKGHAHYQVASTMWEVRQLLFDMDLGGLITPGGYVAAWVTNKATSRDLVLSSEDGLFASWDVDLIEEWIWLKITSQGEPVLPVDGTWRKPYEILLIGRRRVKEEQGRNETIVTQPRSGPRRRVIMAVPDLHSRKPCLKALFRDALVLPDEYRGLEVFARNLTSGWCSWGNEAIKFNDARSWSGDGNSCKGGSEM